MSEFALFITWTCYGNWLPGDKRGYVSNSRKSVGGFEPLQNVPGTPYTADHADSRELARGLQKHETFRLSPEQACLAAGSLVEAAIARGWTIVQGAVMANHLHVIVCDCPDDGSAVRRILKGVSQARLNEREGRSRRRWTQGGSDRYLHGTTAIEATVEYVARQEFMLACIEKNVARRVG